MAETAVTGQIVWETEAATADSASDITTLQSETFTRAKAERFIGTVVTGAEVTLDLEANRPRSLRESIVLAAEGDSEALQSVRMNVKTDVIERSIKKGHITRICQSVDAEGHMVQHGQSGRSIHANSLRYASQNPKILPRTMAETRNLFRIEDARRQGLLKDHYVIVASRPPDNMTEAEMHAEGFFSETMSIALQATTEQPAAGETEDSILTETAFVAGKLHRTAPRHDAELVQALAGCLGIDTAGQSATTTLDRAWLVPKRLMPGGVIDLVRMADEALGTFFGEDRDAQDYDAYAELCQERERELESTVEVIMTQLLAEAAHMRTPVDATRRLHELSEAALVQRAIYDEAIDSMVFGAESAQYIEAARYYLDRGDMLLVDELLGKAVITADSSSCPGGFSKQNEIGESTGWNMGAEKGGDDGDCEFVSKQCPLCKTKNVKTLVRKTAGGKKRISGSCGCSTVV